MRRILVLCFWICSLALQGQQLNLPLLSQWDDDSIPSASYGPYSECWGYSANGREYAFLGTSKETCFLDITDPYHPVLIDRIATRDTVTLVINKDYETYSHYLYAVSDQGNNSLQIFDLQYLPDSVVVAYDSDAISKRCHTLFVERDRLYMCHNTHPDGSYGKMDIYSLANPVSPQFLGTVSDPGFFTTHEVYVRNDTAYCANGYNGLWIYKVSNPASPQLIGKIDIYTQNGYNHSAWLSDDSRTLVFTDENHGYGVKIFDISDFQDPQLQFLLRSNMLNVPDPSSGSGSIPHNPYMVGNTLLLSYYHDGVQAFDISDPSNPVQTGYYVTDPVVSSYNSYSGCWGLYPFLPSKHILASDMHNGLLVLDGSSVFDYHKPDPLHTSVSLVTNLVSDILSFQYESPNDTEMEIVVTDLSGKLVMQKRQVIFQGNASFNHGISMLSRGMYLVNVSMNDMNRVLRFVKQ